MKIVTLVGMPCSGKSTALNIIKTEYDIPGFSTGDIARGMTFYDKKTSESLNIGGYANEDLMRQEVTTRINSYGEDGNEFLIIDGFPRNIEQHRFLLESPWVESIDYMEIDIPPEISRIRNQNRGRNDMSQHDNRIIIYNRDVMPMLEYAERSIDSLIYTINGNSSPEEFKRDICRIVEDYYVYS